MTVSWLLNVKDKIHHYLQLLKKMHLINQSNPGKGFPQVFSQNFYACTKKNEKLDQFSCKDSIQNFSYD